MGLRKGSGPEEVEQVGWGVSGWFFFKAGPSKFISTGVWNPHAFKTQLLGSAQTLPAQHLLVKPWHNGREGKDPWEEPRRVLFLLASALGSAVQPWLTMFAWTSPWCAPFRLQRCLYKPSWVDTAKAYLPHWILESSGARKASVQPK